MKLPESSCARCADQTGKVEGVVTGLILKHVRTHLGMKTKRPKQRLKELPVSLPDGTANVPVADHPFFLTLQEFPGLGVLGFPPGDPQELSMRLHTSPETGNRQDALGKEVGVPLAYNAMAMQRMLAKMAHSYAAAVLGLEAFNPWLLGVILGKRSARPPNWLVGSIPGQNMPAPGVSNNDKMPPISHTIRLSRGVDRSGVPLLLCEITLFEQHGMPVYHVAVGSLPTGSDCPEAIASYTQET